jgi:undecaprenyl-diphosphatase
MSMTIIESIILGAVQGLTEFIPVSSSGHVVLAEHFMSGASDHLFIEWINLGTVLALLIFFRKRILNILQDIFVHKNYTLARNLLIACIPAGLAGFLLAGYIEENSFFTSAVTVTVALAIIGVIMIVLEKLPRFSEVDGSEKLSWQRSLAIGFAQVRALVPGASRSGTTIIAGRLAGLNRENAAEFSFLVSIPIMFGVILKLLIKSSDRAYLFDNLPTLLIANAVAFITGLFAVGFMMKFLKKNSLAPFGWYRIGLAVVVGVVLLVQ